jgi:hypothetical protein
MFVEAAQITMAPLMTGIVGASSAHTVRSSDRLQQCTCVRVPNSQHSARRDCCCSWLDLVINAGMIGPLVPDPRRYACNMPAKWAALNLAYLAMRLIGEGVMRPSDEPGDRYTICQSLPLRSLTASRVVLLLVSLSCEPEPKR